MSKRNSLRISLIVLMFFILIYRYFLIKLIPNMLLATFIMWGILALFLILLIGIARPMGITNGIGGILYLLGYVWSIMVSLNGYEAMFMSRFMLFELPQTLFWGGACYLLIDIIVKQSVTNSASLRIQCLDLGLSFALVSLLYPLLHLPRWTLAFIDQGIRIPYFRAHFIYASFAIIGMLLLAIGLLVATILAKNGWRAILSGSLAVISALLLAFCYFSAPFLFWTGISALLISSLIISMTLAIPTTSMTK